MWHPLLVWGWPSAGLPAQIADGGVMGLGELAAGGQGLVGVGRGQAVLDGLQDFQELDAQGFDRLIDRATQEPPVGSGDAVPAGEQPQLLAEIVQDVFLTHGGCRGLGPGERTSRHTGGCALLRAVA